MKIKEIRLEKIKVINNNEEIYNGSVDNATNDILELDVTSIHFEPGILVIET